MAKIVVIMSVGSHQNATFSLAKELVEHGHEIVYAGTKTGIYDESLAANVLAQNFCYKILDPYNYNIEATIDPSLNEPTNNFINFANNLFEGQLFSEFINKVQPDVILLDIHLPIHAIALFPFNIPVLFISTELDTDRNEFNPPLTSSLIPQLHEQPESAIEDAWCEHSIRNPLHPAVKHLIQELSSENGFPLDEYIKEKCIVMFGLKYPELVLWPREFEFYPDQQQTNEKYYIGSHVDVDRYEENFDWSSIDPNKPLIYCALGTVVDHELLIAFLSKLVSTFEYLTNYQFVISAGRVHEKLKIPNELSENIHIYKFVPQITILRKSVLMITLGGANSIKESIALEVPMLCYPFHSDQFGNAARVVYHKLGLRGDILKDSSHTISRKIEKIINDKSFRENIKNFQKIFESYKTKNAYLSIINSII